MGPTHAVGSPSAIARNLYFITEAARSPSLQTVVDPVNVDHENLYPTTVSDSDRSSTNQHAQTRSCAVGHVLVLETEEKDDSGRPFRPRVKVPSAEREETGSPEAPRGTQCNETKGATKDEESNSRGCSVQRCRHEAARSQADGQETGGADRCCSTKSDGSDHRYSRPSGDSLCSNE